MNPRGLWDLDPLGNHEHPCASRTVVYIGFHGALNPVDPSDSSYNLYLYQNKQCTHKIDKFVANLKLIYESLLNSFHQLIDTIL